MPGLVFGRPRVPVRHPGSYRGRVPPLRAGAAIAVSYRARTNGPPVTVKLQVQARSERLDAEPGPGFVDLQLLESHGDAGTELTPGEARTLAAALLMLADIAQRRDSADAGTQPG